MKAYLPVFRWRLRLALATALAWLIVASSPAAVLTGSFERVPQGSNVNLTALGTVDWVHWGLLTETSLDRKASVTPRISDYTVFGGLTSNAFVIAYQYADNFNGYSWSDGTPVMTVNDTTTGVWAYGIPNLGTGFEFTVPADITVRTLKVFVGVFRGAGSFEASLSDDSAGPFSELNAFANNSNGPGAVFTLDFAAASPGQTLTVRWRLTNSRGPDANVTLQAATLANSGANNPPIVALTSPAPNSNLVAPASVSLSANASDADGSIAKVEFFEGSNKIGQAASATSPFTASWSNVQPGRYTLTAIATDNGGETTTSAPVDIFVYTTGGTLVVSNALGTNLPRTVNLTTEGAADWVHWGLSPSNALNRKAGVSQKIAPVVLVGASDFLTYTDNYSGFTWTDGTPTAAASDLKHGIFVYGLRNGFELSVPANSTAQRLRVFVGAYGAKGHFRAWLSDFSTPEYHNLSVSNFYSSAYAAFTLDFASASAGKSLFVRYQSDELYDHQFGNVTLQAALLQGGSAAGSPVRLFNPALNGTDFRLSFDTQAGHTYQAWWIGTLGAGTWNNFATIPGTGGTVSVTNHNTSGSQRFYRVETQ